MGTASSAPNLNLFIICLTASSPAIAFFSRSMPVGSQSHESPKVPMSSAFITTAPTPKPPPTVAPTYLSNLDNLFNSSILVFA